MSDYSDDDLIYWCQLCLEVGRSKDRWKEIRDSGKADKLGLTSKTFEDEDQYIATFIRRWKYHLNDPLTDLYLRSHLHPDPYRGID